MARSRGVMLIGDDILISKLRATEKEMNHKVARAMQKAGGEIIRVAIPKTPLKTGELRKRSFNEGPLEKDGIYSQVVGYEKFADLWDKDNPYAVAVHENLEAKHRVGEAKYLEKAVNETAPKLEKYLAKQVKL